MADEQKIAHLMTKRVEVIAHYPGSPFAIGEILYEYSNGEDRWYEQLPSSPLNQAIPAAEVEKSTANFMVLAWWEKRTVDEMPEYVKRENSIEIFKVARWGEMQFYIYSNIEAGKINDFVWLDQFQPLPATLTEYLTYQQSKK